MKRLPAGRLLTWTLCNLILNAGVQAAESFRLGETGALLDPQGEVFIPLGGYYSANFPRQLTRVLNQYTISQDVSESEWRDWFQLLHDHGCNMIRVFPRVHYGDTWSREEDPLDVGGHLNPRVWEFLERYMAVALEYGMRFHFVLMSEPRATVYCNPGIATQFGLPLYLRNGWVQNRFVNEDPEQRRPIPQAEYFTHPEAVALQKAYLRELLSRLDYSQVAVLEVFNEQGHEGWAGYLMWDSEEQEIDWTEEMIQEVKSWVPDVAVCISHAGHGVVGMDPLRWIGRIPSADFYSFHTYPCSSGDNTHSDYGVIPRLIGQYVRPAVPIACGESGLLVANVPEPERSYGLRDTIWSTFAGGAFGFFQWYIGRQDTSELREFASARAILSEHPIPAWHRKRPRWALDATAMAQILGASQDLASKATNPPWTTYTEWDAYFRRYAAAYDLVRNPTGYDEVFDPFSMPPDRVPPDRPVRVEGPYEGLPLIAEEATFLYLRNGHPAVLGWCYHRVKAPGALTLTLAPDQSELQAVVYDLDDSPGNPRIIYSGPALPGQSFLHFGQTDHDFAVFLLPTQ